MVLKDDGFYYFRRSIVEEGVTKTWTKKVLQTKDMANAAEVQKELEVHEWVQASIVGADDPLAICDQPSPISFRTTAYLEEAYEAMTKTIANIRRLGMQARARAMTDAGRTLIEDALKRAKELESIHVQGVFDLRMANDITEETGNQCLRAASDAFAKLLSVELDAKALLKKKMSESC